MEPVYTPVLGFARTLFAAQGLKFTIRGADNIPRTGGAVMAINHTGYLDFTYAGLAARPSGRLVRFMAKKSVFEHKVSGPIMRGMKHIPVDRRSGASAFRQAVQMLRAGEIVGVYPEATMSLSFEIKDFKNGAVRMAQLAGVPIIPTVVWGAQRVWTKGGHRRLGRHRFPIHISVGEPMVLDRKGDADALTAQLRQRMIELLDELQAGYPAFGPDEQHLLPARLGGTAPTPEEAREREQASITRTTDEFSQGRKERRRKR
jgi:1-acyl-sn-glycerol-3-phosphate acyltransferase